ncbi:tigger transposable element-derived protein 6-like [Ornithodoros turicata]|uniref:tigger transposable element-derived protein 6-like n=1 Tax=Ornithodoros turicata TaxID=34597 RepID=UPI00313A2DCE
MTSKAPKRKQSSLNGKLAVLRAVDAGRKKCDVAKEFGISASTLSIFLKDREKIEREHATNNRGPPPRKRIRAANFEDVDKAVLKWFLEVRSQNIPVTGPMLCAMAKDFSVIFGVGDQFKGTQGLLRAFRARHDIVSKGLAGEEKSTPQDVAIGWREKELKKVLLEYEPDDIFNADQTALFFKLLPERTMKVKGSKRSKERVTVLLCCNMTGSVKVKPLVMGKSRKPNAFKNVRSIPVDYDFNNKAWMTARIFTDWLMRLDRKMKNERRSIVLILDNCSAHSKLPKMSNVNAPRNCTSLRSGHNSLYQGSLPEAHAGTRFAEHQKQRKMKVTEKVSQL